MVTTVLKSLICVLYKIMRTKSKKLNNACILNIIKDNRCY